jgi:hypothetical protein
MRVVPILALLRLSQNEACLGVTGLITSVLELRHTQIPFVLCINQEQPIRKKKKRITYLES